MIEFSKINRDGLKQHFTSLGSRPGIMACPDRKFIYMKPTKTGGTSIYRNTLQKLVPGMLDMKTNPTEFSEWFDELNDETLETYYIFSVVRNPWDRIVSVAAYFDIPFKKLVKNFESYRKETEIEIHTRPLSLYTHLADKPYINQFCRFESLQADFNLVCDRIGIARINIPHSNRSKHKHYSEYYDQETRELVEELYADDIRHFGYICELPLPELGHKYNFNRIIDRVRKKFFSKD